MLETMLNVLKERGINHYQAAIMAAQEARVINDKVHLGILEVDQKPASIALEKLMDGRVVLADEEGIEG